jgi:hypothetical protein
MDLLIDSVGLRGNLPSLREERECKSEREKKENERAKG